MLRAVIEKTGWTASDSKPARILTSAIKELEGLIRLGRGDNLITDADVFLSKTITGIVELAGQYPGDFSSAVQKIVRAKTNVRTFEQIWMILTASRFWSKRERGSKKLSMRWALKVLISRKALLK